MHDIDDKIQFWCLHTNFKPLRAKKPILAKNAHFSTLKKKIALTNIAIKSLKIGVFWRVSPFFNSTLQGLPEYDQKITL